MTTAVAEYSPIEAGLADLRSRYAGVAWDLRTVVGNDAARKARKELVSLRTTLEDRRKEIKAPLLAQTKLIDAEAKRITDELLAIERPTDDEIIDAISLHYRVHESTVIGWLLAMDLEAASARMVAAI